MGWRRVSDCAAALRSREGATTVSAASSLSASTSARRPGAWMPSSLVIKIWGMKVRADERKLHQLQLLLARFWQISQYRAKRIVANITGIYTKGMSLAIPEFPLRFSTRVNARGI